MEMRGRATLLADTCRILPVPFKNRMTTTTSQSSTAESSTHRDRSVPFNWAALVLGLLVPGGGHFFLGHRDRAIRIFLGFALLWGTGLLVGGFGSVRTWNPTYVNPAAGGGRNLWFIPQLGAGPIAPICAALDSSLIQNASNEDRIDITLNAPGRPPGTAYRYTAVGHAADFGTLFCALAGLMNIAVALDAGRRPAEDRRSGSRS